MKVGESSPSTSREIGSGKASGTSKTEKVREGGGRSSRISKSEASDSDDKVEISERAKVNVRDTAKAKELAKAAPDVDEAKVAKLKAAIKNGSYKVDEDAIADRMVDDHLSFSI